MNHNRFCTRLDGVPLLLFIHATPHGRTDTKYDLAVIKSLFVHVLFVGRVSCVREDKDSPSTRRPSTCHHPVDDRLLSLTDNGICTVTRCTLLFRVTAAPYRELGGVETGERPGCFKMFIPNFSMTIY